MDKEITEEMRSKLEEAATLQTGLWLALGELETMTGLEIDSAQDLAATTIEALFEADDEEDEEVMEAAYGPTEVEAVSEREFIRQKYGVDSVVADAMVADDVKRVTT